MMKSLVACRRFLWTLLLCLGVILSCNTSAPLTGQAKKEKTEPVYRELADILRQEPGVDVKGNSPNYSITIRGKKTFLTSSAPLYVLDGITVGDSYAQVAQMINVTDIASVRILKGSEATSWGSRGANGVIEIRMKRGNN